MGKQIVEITHVGYSLSKSRGFLTISDKSKVIGQIPFDDIATVIISTLGANVSTVLIDHLGKNNIPLVISGDNYVPTSIVLPIVGQNRQFKVMQAQVNITQPKRKKAWQKIIQAKIKNQAEVLMNVNAEHKQLRALQAKVRSGDEGNIEAQAAKVYWRNLFGSKFRRDRQATGINTVLNYTYAIVRASVARSLVGAGLHPSFSIHHINPQNPINLVEDLFEPFRPVVDFFVWQNIDVNNEQLDADIKKKLVEVLNVSIPIDNEHSPLSIATSKMCRSVAAYYLSEEKEIVFPNVPSKLEIQS